MSNLFNWLYLWLPLWLRPRLILDLRDGHWRTLRAQHLEKEPACVACGRTKNLNVHHIIPVAFDKAQELNPENLITLCSDPCHLVFGHFLSYSCYNKDVRVMAEAYRKAFDKRRCLPGKD